ncbi:hypothetical protein Poli38472_006084 [Pythium oligandrum]|uniref:RIIa domain-containing protein n=1 Tax=Pythium oligandrum TaxID=41045 RepID=A0A8K1CRR5_PYTOL|nr:hypothetical protein Poli38472_006084 [Pythium oligandrum]|eukprot:TMW68616.1 hypothetical protein Poli38472_006084 [Pythium oligandrum]
MDAKGSKARNKGVVACERVREEQHRYHEQDPQMQRVLEENYDYMVKHLDPVMSQAIEKVLLYQPDQAADFLAQYFRGTLEVKNYHYVEFQRQQYYDRKVRHLLALAMNSAVKDRPDDVRLYFADFFDARTKFY